MCNDDGILIIVGHSGDEIFTILPQSQVLAITLVSVQCDIPFARVCVDKNDLVAAKP